MSTRLPFLLLIAALLNWSLPALSQSLGQLKELSINNTAHFANNVDFSKDGNYFVVVVGFNADVYQRKETGFQLLQTIKGGRWQAYNGGISEDGSYVCFSNYEDTYVYKRNGDRYSLFHVIKHAGAYDNKDLVMRFSGNDKLLIIGGAGNIRFYELRETSFEEVKRVTTPDNIILKEAALSANGQQMATINDKGEVHCWQITADNAVRGNLLLKTNPHVGMVDITDDLLLAAGTSDSLLLYRIAPDRNTALRFHEFEKDKFGQVCFNPDGNRVMVANQSGQLSVFKITNNLVSLESFNKLISNNFTSLRMSYDSKWIAGSSSGGKTISFFEAPVRIIPVKATAKNTPGKGKTTPTKASDKKGLPASAAKEPSPKATSAPTPAPTYFSPFDVAKYVRSGAVKDLITYCQILGSKYTKTINNGNTDYKIDGIFVNGVENFTVSKEGITVVYKFKERAEKTAYIQKVKEEGFVAKEINPASVTMYKDGVDIWIATMGNTWIISKSTGPGMTQAQLDSAAAAFKANADDLNNKVKESNKAMEAMKKAEADLKKAMEEYQKQKGNKQN